MVISLYDQPRIKITELGAVLTVVYTPTGVEALTAVFEGSSPETLARLIKRAAIYVGEVPMDSVQNVVEAD